MKMMMMAQLVLALGLVAVLLQGASAEEYTVGNNTGWTNVRDTSIYTNWASGIRFEVGDDLIFNFATSAHDVAVVTKDAYDNCNTANPLSISRTGPTTIPLNTTGAHYYICTFAGHCSGGQKLSINVVAENSPPSAGTPPTTNGTTSSPPPPSSSSASTQGVAFALFLMSLAVAFFC